MQANKSCIGNWRGGQFAVHPADAPSLLSNDAGAGDISASDSDEDEVHKPSKNQGANTPSVSEARGT